jgi:NAD(P)-dependent dehydrogenase (short-subunit alcohol dehydrogenase family)
MMARSDVVVITGASAGVGRATAKAFAREGARIGLLARDEAALRETAAEVELTGGRGFPVVTDVTKWAEVETAAAAVEAELGPIDIWVNNAMATIFGPAHEIDPAEFRRATEATYLGTVHGTMAALHRMRPRNRGTIVQVGSALSYRAIPLQSAYCGAKFAIRGFTDSVRCELLHDRSRVHITMVQLPAVNTPQFDWALNLMPRKPQPVPPIFQPEVAADAIVWATHHRRREVLVGSSTLQAVYGSKIAPGLLDRMMAGKAWDGQMRPEAEGHDRPSNLYAPVHGLHTTQGAFSGQAKQASPLFWLTTHRGLAAAGVAAAAIGLAAGLMLKRSRGLPRLSGRRG